MGVLFPLLLISYIVWQMGDVFFTMQQNLFPASNRRQVLGGERQRQDSGFLVGLKRLVSGLQDIPESLKNWVQFLWLMQLSFSH